MVDDILSQVSGVKSAGPKVCNAKKSTVSVRGMGSDRAYAYFDRRDSVEQIIYRKCELEHDQSLYSFVP
jgi:hypothetical protein